jgi:hypothetical protein
MSYYSDLETAITALGTGEKNTAEEVRFILRMMLKGISLEGDIRSIYMTPEEIAANFDEDGLGINEREGWARCNGINGTIDHSGAVGIGYGSGYTAVGTRIGSNSKPIAVPLTGYTPGEASDGGAAGVLLVSSGENESNEFLESVKKVNPEFGSTATVNVMQTSVILVYIQRI